MFFVRLFLPFLAILAIALVFTAPRWSKWLAKFTNRAQANLDEAGNNLKDIGKKEEKVKKNKTESGQAALVLSIIGGVLVVLVLLFFVFFRRVTPGQVGIFIDYNNPLPGQRANIKPVTPGQWVFVGFNQDLQSYPFSQQSLIMVRSVQEGQVKGDDSIECKDNTGIKVNVDLTVIWKIIPDEIGPLYLNYPDRDINQISDQLVRRIARQSAADACGQFGFIDIAGTGRIGFGQKIADLLGPRLDAEHIELVDTSLGEVYLEQAQQDAITAKSIAQQQALQAQFLQKQREAEAQAAIAQAEGAKQVVILQAQAQAEAIKIVREELGGTSDYYLRYLYVKAWNGAVPYVLVTGNGQAYPLINLPPDLLPTVPPASSQPMPTPTPGTGH